MVPSLKVRFDFFLWPLFFPPEKKRKSEKENEREKKRERGRAKQSLDPALLVQKFRRFFTTLAAKTTFFFLPPPPPPQHYSHQNAQPRRLL